MRPRPVSTPPLRVKTVDRLGELAPEWDRLVEEQRLPTPFLKSWWIENTAATAPTILCFFDGDDLIGGAAFEVDRVGAGPFDIERVRCVGQGVLAPDHLDVITTPEDRGRVLSATLDWLQRKGSRLVDLDGLAAEGALGQALSSSQIDSVEAPFATLTPDAGAYLAERPGKLRSTVKRGRNRLARQGVAYSRVQVADDAELNRALDSLAELHDDRWSGESNFLQAFDRFRTAAVQGADSGDIRIHELSGPESGVIAVEVDLVAGARACFYQAGRRTERDWRGCGTVLRADLIDRIGIEGIDEYDLLRGDEGYKSDWSTGKRGLLRCRFGVGPVGRPLAAAVNAWVRCQPLLARVRSSLRDLVSRAPWPGRREPRTET